MAGKRRLCLPLVFMMLSAAIMVGINTVSVNALPPPEGALHLFDAVDMDHYVNWTYGSEPGTYPNFYVKVMTTNVSQYYSTVFSVVWDPAILDLITITPGNATAIPPDVTGPFIFGPSYGEWNHISGELREWTYGQLAPVWESLHWYNETTTPVWGWVATLKFKFVGTPPAGGCPIDTYINLTYSEPDYKTGWWKYIDYLRRPFSTLGSCHFHYQRLIHDVAVTGLDAPGQAPLGELVHINVTITNEGAFEESVTVTVSYDETPIDTTVIDMLPPGELETALFDWDTTGLNPGTYTINATATIALDEDPGDNFKTTTIELKPCVEYPGIYVQPVTTVDPTLTPGHTYTVSIKTDYTGNDVQSWQFTLFYNSDVLWGGLNRTDMWTGDGVNKTFMTTGRPLAPDSEKVYVSGILKSKPADYTIDYVAGNITFKTAPGVGAEIKAVYFYGGVTNGDLITTIKNPSAMFLPGTFDNSEGELSLTGAFFMFVFEPAPVTSGPGTLAYVTFTVVGVGESNITIGDATKLIGYTDVRWGRDIFGLWKYGGWGDPYDIINAEIMPDHIGHGYFRNTPPIHDVAVVNLDAPAEAPLGQLVPINVTVANEGDFAEDIEVTVCANITEIGTQNVTDLAPGSQETVTFSWNTAGLSPGNYTINATATIALDEDPGDNFKTTTIELELAFVGYSIIYVDPATTVDPKLTPGNTYTISIKTNYTGDDIYAWQLSLRYNPSVLHGVNVTNGDLVTTERHPTATFWPGTFNNTVGKLSVTTGFFFFLLEPAPITSGPGTLANVTFIVVGTGESNITLGRQTKLVGYTNDGYGDPYKIVDGEIPDQLFHGYFNNIPPIHDVAIVDVVPSRTIAGRGFILSVRATVVNEGDFTEAFPVTLYANTTIPLDTEVVTLPSGNSTTISFRWNTTGFPYSNYTLSAYAWPVTNETDTADNTLIDGRVIVTIVGDVDGDFDVDADDVFMYVSLAYGTKIGDPKYNPYCDFDGDGDVDADDTFMCLAPNYGKKV